MPDEMTATAGDWKEDESGFELIRITLGTDGDAYYTAVYRNGEPGPRSEGYRGRSTDDALRRAFEAARRDFPRLRIEVDRT